MNIEELMEMEDKRQSIESEINSLISSLDAPTSPIGDWKITKIYEARLKNEKDPYDFDDLSKKRQEVRDKINELQKELDSL